MFKQAIAALGISILAQAAAAQQTGQYEVSITNITTGQFFTPQLVLSHSRDYLMFRLGDPASDAQ